MLGCGMTRVVGALLALVLGVLLGAVFPGQAFAETTPGFVLSRSGCSGVEDREDRRQCRRGEGREVIFVPVELGGEDLGPRERGKFWSDCEPGETGVSVRVRAYGPNGEKLDARRHVRVRSSYNEGTRRVIVIIRNKTREPVSVSVNGNCVGDPTT